MSMSKPRDIPEADLELLASLGFQYEPQFGGLDFDPSTYLFVRKTEVDKDRIEFSVVSKKWFCTTNYKQSGTLEEALADALGKVRFLNAGNICFLIERYFAQSRVQYKASITATANIVLDEEAEHLISLCLNTAETIPVTDKLAELFDYDDFRRQLP